MQEEKFDPIPKTNDANPDSSKLSPKTDTSKTIDDDISKISQFDASHYETQ